MVEMIVIGCVILIGILYILISNIYVWNYGKKYIYKLQDIKKVPKSDYIIVPGARIFKDRPGGVLKDRMDAAINIYELKKSKEIFASGAFELGPNRHEVDLMKEYFNKIGISDEHILTDFLGYNTYKTMYRAKSYYKDKTAIICTQKIFAPRTLYLARSLGIDACVIICNKQLHYNNEVKFFFREILSRAKAVFNVNVYSSPTAGFSKEDLK